MKNSKTLVDYLKELVISLLFIFLIVVIITVPVVEISYLGNYSFNVISLALNNNSDINVGESK